MHTQLHTQTAAAAAAAVGCVRAVVRWCGERGDAAAVAGATASCSSAADRMLTASVCIAAAESSLRGDLVAKLWGTVVALRTQQHERSRPLALPRRCPRAFARAGGALPLPLPLPLARPRLPCAAGGLRKHRLSRTPGARRGTSAFASGCARKRKREAQGETKEAAFCLCRRRRSDRTRLNLLRLLLLSVLFSFPNASLSPCTRRRAISTIARSLSESVDQSDQVKRNTDARGEHDVRSRAAVDGAARSFHLVLTASLCVFVVVCLFQARPL